MSKNETYKNENLKKLFESNQGLTEDEKENIWTACKCFSQAVKNAYNDLKKD